MQHCKLCMSTAIVGRVVECYHDADPSIPRNVIGITTVCADHVDEAMEGDEGRPTYFYPNGVEWAVEEEEAEEEEEYVPYTPSPIIDNIVWDEVKKTYVWKENA